MADDHADAKDPELDGDADAAAQIDNAMSAKDSADTPLSPTAPYDVEMDEKKEASEISASISGSASTDEIQRAQTSPTSGSSSAAATANSQSATTRIRAHLQNQPGEKWTQGLADLDLCCEKYFAAGAYFAMWRAVLLIHNANVP